MERLYGAPAARNLSTTRIDSEQPVYYFESAILPLVDKLLDWEKVRIAGRLPLFAASYSALIAIPLFFYFLEIYNDKVVLLRGLAQGDELAEIAGLAQVIGCPAPGAKQQRPWLPPALDCAASVLAADRSIPQHEQLPRPVGMITLPDVSASRVEPVIGEDPRPRTTGPPVRAQNIPARPPHRRPTH